MFSMHTMLVNHLQYNLYPPPSMTDDRYAQCMAAVEEVASFGEDEKSSELVEYLRLEDFVEWYTEFGGALCHHCEKDLGFWDQTLDEMKSVLCTACINKQEGD